MSDKFEECKDCSNYDCDPFICDDCEDADKFEPFEDEKFMSYDEFIDFVKEAA